jgi:hypothetical protein
MLPSLVAQASDGRQKSLYSCPSAWHSPISTRSLLATFSFYFSSHNTTAWYCHTFRIVTGRYLEISYSTRVSWFPLPYSARTVVLRKAVRRYKHHTCAPKESNLKSRVWIFHCPFWPKLLTILPRIIVSIRSITGIGRGGESRRTKILCKPDLSAALPRRDRFAVPSEPVF